QSLADWQGLQRVDRRRNRRIDRALQTEHHRGPWAVPRGETGRDPRSSLQFNSAQLTPRQWTGTAFPENQSHPPRQERGYYRHSAIRSGTRRATRKFAGSFALKRWITASYSLGRR